MEANMNLNEMITTKEEKEMLLSGLVRVMYADGKLSETEKEFLEQVSIGLDCNETDIDSLKMTNKPITFNDSKSCMFFVTQAVQLCYADGKYETSEQKEMLAICKEMGISEESLHKVEKWVEEGIEWNNRGMGLLNLK